MKRNIYVASSWRNPHQPAVVALLRALGHDVFDFRRQPGADLPTGFHWSEIDPDWERWSPDEYRDALDHPLAEAGYSQDFAGMNDADTCVLVQPCGRSAHLEMGFMAGQGKEVIVYFPDGENVEPELMAKMAKYTLVGVRELEVWAKGMLDSPPAAGGDA